MEKSNKRNKRVVTVAIAIVTLLALLMTGCSAQKSDEERWNDTKNIVSADSLEDNTDYSKFETEEDILKDDESKDDESKENLLKEDKEVSNTESKGSKEEKTKEDVKPKGNSENTIGNGTDEKPKKEEALKENNKVDNKVDNATTVKTCTISISCATILNNMDNLTEGKEALVPANGVILGTTTVELKDGDTVFDVLSRVVRSNGIHMEYVNTPAYNSAYIEGIANLYEKDCGSGSGWMYSVNGWYPDYGCSQYDVNDGDVIKWNYTCDLGADL